jgi:hypothetical protein
MRHGAMPAVATISILLAGTAILIVPGGLMVPAGHEVTQSRLIAAIGPELSLSDLSDRAVIVALVSPVPGSHSHWNSSDNQPWEADEDSGLQPMILTDQPVTVLRAWRGARAGDTIAVRTIGGKVGATQIIYENGGALTGSETYIVFLQRDDWRGKDIVDTDVVSPVGLEQGVFVKTGASFSNAAGLTVTLDELSGL